MPYTIHQLARLAGVSARTLRYYDQVGLLSPARIESNGYRIYNQVEVDRLQQILFYRELGMPLEEIRRILAAPDFDRAAALEQHLASLVARRDQINALIANVERTLQSLRGEIEMSDRQKFEGFKQKLVEDNEKQYGAEVRAKYGDEAVEKSDQKVLGTSEEQYAELEKLQQEMEETLKQAIQQSDPAGELAQKACELHKQWLTCFYPAYSKEYHKGLAQMYVDDERFRATYDRIAPGAAEFLREAIEVYISRFG